jgi:hypothetical protein
MTSQPAIRAIMMSADATSGSCRLSQCMVRG